MPRPPRTRRPPTRKVFELRTYVTNPGKLDALNKRFREHTTDLFKKHGMEVIGYWTPAAGPTSENTLIYLLAFPSVEAQKKAWAAFQQDPEWKKVSAESEKDGPILKSPGGVTSVTMKATDYSPLH